MKNSFSKKITKVALSVFVSALLLSVGLNFLSSNQASADCAPSPSYGTDTLTVNVPSTTTYYFWIRMMSPDGTNNQVMASVDGGNCYTFGAIMNAGAWTWVDTQASGGARVSMSLTSGTHTIELFGNEPGVGVDEIQLLADPSCTPVGTSNNCTTNQTSPPVVGIASLNPSELSHGPGLNISGTAASSDSGTISTCSLTANSQTVQTSSSADFSFTLNTLNYPDGYLTVKVNCNDSLGASGNTSTTIIVDNGDLTGSGSVGLADLSILASHWGQADPNYADGNITGQSTINISDLSVIARNWGWTKP